MPSLRQRVTTYFRQLSFINEPRDDSRIVSSLSPRHQDDGCFITKYLEGRMDLTYGNSIEIINGKEPSDMPDFVLFKYPIGIDCISAASTGPDEGLTGVKRSKLHLSAGPDIDFIDTLQDIDNDIRHSGVNPSIKKNKYLFKPTPNQPSSSSSTNHLNLDQNANSSSSSINKRRNPRKNSITQQDKMKNSSKVDLNLIDNQVSSIMNEGDAIKTKNLVNNKVRSRPNSSEITQTIEIDPIAGVANWRQEHDHAYGLSVSLYEKNPITNEQAGNPIADCYGLVARDNVVAMALADGVNWGEGARLAARSAVQGSLEYLNTAVFGLGPGGMATSTREVFISLLRCFWEAHAFILEVGGALSTLTVAVILPLDGKETGRYIVCSCNVGDSLGYVYSKSHGVREFTQGSHDITSMRDMRDALGALGPVDGKDPELGNLTLSTTIVDDGDIVFLTSDGVSDNFDPVVGKFAEAFTSESQISNEPKTNKNEATTTNNAAAQSQAKGLAPKRQNKSASAIYTTSTAKYELAKSGSTSKVPTGSKNSPTHNTPLRPSRTKKPKPLSINVPDQSSASAQLPPRPKYVRSHTVIETTRIIKAPTIKFPKSAAGLPLVTGVQRHALTLLRLEDLLCYGINGTLKPCTSAKKLCQLLVDFVKMITSAKRKILEQRELYYKLVTRADGIKCEVELTRIQQRSARKKVVDGTTFSLLPGKLDHATVVAFTIGGGRASSAATSNLQAVGFTETNF